MKYSKPVNLLLVVCFFLSLHSCQKEGGTTQKLLTSETPAEFVNPLIGTGGHGHTYPGATMPFGMVQLSPDTRLEGWDGCSGYHHTDAVIYGFSHTHLSGTGVSDYGDILLMPTTGPIIFNNGYDGKNGYASPFDKATEEASAGYYKVKLEKYNIDVALTATERVGIHQYQFPEKDTANVIIDLDHRDRYLSTGFKQISDTEVGGFRVSDAWAREQHVYFVARFSRPILHIRSDTTAGQRNYALQFAPDRKPLTVKVGISPVDIAGAQKNLDKEAADKTFDELLEAGKKKWNEQLSKIAVKSTDEETMKIFYTALYHTSIVPNKFMDVDRRYRGMDMNIYTAEDYDRYTIFSLWDTYRATHPLFTIIEQERTNQFIRTFLKQYKEGGKLPMWELACNYTGCMIGYHAVPVIADAYIKGIRDYDADLALEAMVSTATTDELGKSYYQKMGYIPTEKEHESVSKTLEYAYDDWTIAQMAKALNEEAIYKEFIQRAQFYKNIFDPQSHLMRGKTSHRWWTPFYPEEVNFNYTEANAWQYSFYVPQDISGLIELHGGIDSIDKKLDQLFTVSSQTYGRDLKDISGLIGQYAHGNEPSHHMAFLYNYLGKPWKSQRLARQILQELYHNAADGLSGNEDCGQMSAWYVLSSMGLYPVTPGSQLYTITTPILHQASINLENGRRFTITVSNQSEDNHYIQSASLNGQAYKKSYIRHKDIMLGGTLELTLGPKPNKSWGVGKANIPESKIDDHIMVPVPGIAKGKRSFSKRDTILLNHPLNDAQIYYTLDGSAPEVDANGRFLNNTEKYKGPIYIDTTAELRAIAWQRELGSSKEIRTTFFEIPSNRAIKIANEYASYYAAGGDMALIDYVVGEPDFRTGEWQGYYGVDLDVVVDLGEDTYLNYLAITFLQDQNSWIFMPTEVVFEVSEDGQRFTTVAERKTKTDPRADGAITEIFEANLNEQARYIRVRGINRGICPPWHKGAGSKAWVFADEIIINQEIQ